VKRVRLLTFLAVALILSGLPTRPAAADSAPRLTAYQEGVRFDLRSQRFLPAGRTDGPQSSEAFLLPTPVRLRAVRDEVVAVQVLVSGAPGTYPLSVVAEAASTSSVSPELSLYQAQPVVITGPSTSDFIHSLGPGTYPGPLKPTTTATISEQGVALLWLDAFVPLGTPPGGYAWQLKVGQSSLRLHIEVLPLDLPREDVARLGTVNFGSLIFRDQEQPGLQRRWMQMAHAHGVSVEVLRPTPKVRPDHSIDWQEWAERVGPYIDGSAFSAEAGYRGPREGLPTTRWVLPLTDWWPDEASKDRLPSKPERWSQALKQWEAFAEAKGWFEHAQATTWIMFINSLDEPHDPETVQSLARYAALLDDAKLKDRSRVLFRVDGNWGQKIEGYDDQRMEEVLGEVTDLWNVHSAPWTIPWSRLQRLRRTDGDRVMAYFSNTSGEPSLPPMVIDAPVIGARAWGWVVARYGLEGLLNWEIDYWAEGCATDPKCSPGGQMNLEANLIFRAEAYGGRPGDAWASIRLKGLRRGAQDAALWSLLRAKDPDVAGQIAQALVPRALGDRVPDVGRGAWSLDPQSYARARNAMLDRLVAKAAPLPIAEVRVDAVPPWTGPYRWWAGLLGTVIVLGAALVYIFKK